MTWSSLLFSNGGSGFENALQYRVKIESSYLKFHCLIAFVSVQENWKYSLYYKNGR